MRHLCRSIVPLASLALAISVSSPSFAFTLNPGDILVSNHGGNNVQRLEPGSGTVSTLTTVPGTPIGLAFDPTGNLYINVNNGIMKLDKATDVLTPFFTGNGQREGLTFDPGTLHFFSVSFAANVLEEVDLSGNLVRTITIAGSSRIIGPATRGTDLIVSDLGSGQIWLGTTTGSTFTSIGNLTPGNTYAVDEDSFGNIYGNDFALGKCVKFTPIGGGLYSPSDFIVGLAAPANGLSIGDDNSLTIDEFGGNAISVWNSNGTQRHYFPGVQNPDELVVFAPIRQGGGCDDDSLPPQFSNPPCGTTYTVLAGDSLTIPVSASDPDSNDAVALTADIPAGATFTATAGNPATGSFSWSPTLLDGGSHTVVFRATDRCQHTDSCLVTIIVITNHDPDCSGAVASETQLWPPNHTYHSISIVGVTDPDGDPLTITVTGITQDEPVNGRGDGNTCPDAQIIGGNAAVRAERTGTPGVPGNGRVYQISFTATDGRGGTCNGTVSVCVPHDQGAGSACIDDGQRYNSLGGCTGGNALAIESLNLTVNRVSGTQADLSFSLPANSHVEIVVFDVAGRRMATLENSDLLQGSYTRSWNTGGVSNGLYFVRMLANGQQITRTVIKAQ